MNLDESQLAFVNSTAANIRLLAPAGSGKTTTLLYRCRRLIEQSPKDKVLLFTFTRVACEELKQRLRTNPDFAEIRENVSVFTLNSYGNRLLKQRFSGFRQLGTDKKARHFVLSNYLRPVVTASPVLAEKIESKSWVAKHARAVLDLMDLMKSLGFDHEQMSSFEGFARHIVFLSENGMVLMVRNIVEKLKEIDCVEGLQGKDAFKKAYENFVVFYQKATEMLRLQNQFTIEDQKYWGWKITQESPKVSGAARYAHIMVDEFQDINPVDLLFVNALRERHQATMTVVGDDDQTIFEWRGATPNYILKPGDFFTNNGEKMSFETFVLAKNYRSPRNVVDISQRLIKRNTERVAKDVTAVSREYADISVMTSDSYDEVVEAVEKDLANPEIKRIAVISRKKSHLIPYQIILAGRNQKFYAAEDLNVMLTDAFNVLKGMIDIKRRQKEMPRQSLMTVVEDLVRLCNAVFRYPMKRPDAEALKAWLYQGNYSDIIGGIQHFAKMPFDQVKGIDPDKYVGRLVQFAKMETVADCIECISDEFTGLKKDYRKADDDIFYADPPFPELAQFARRYGGDFSRFCCDIERTIATLSSVIAADEDKDMSEAEREKLNAKLCLMTGLRTKGKEFDSVYVLHSDQDVWPIKMAVAEDRVEAERRLFYVAVTRAKKKLTFVTGATQLPSPYLSEMGLI
jgi:DNA helicase II / ATP-dependent DNA helicase PcrA